MKLVMCVSKVESSRYSYSPLVVALLFLCVFVKRNSRKRLWLTEKNQCTVFMNENIL